MRQLLPLVPLFVSVLACAEWVRVGDMNSPEIEKHIDPDNVRQSGPMAIMRQIWEIDHDSSLKKYGVASVKALVEYDCQNRQRRLLKQFWFSEPWAKGQELPPPQMHQAEGGWSPIMPRSAGETVIGMVCPSGEDG